MKHIFCTFILLVTAMPAFAAVKKDIAFGRLDRQKLDIYTPDNAQGAPVMVHVHGGGWHIGNKSRIQEKPKAFNNKGFIFVSIGYPLLPGHGVKTQAQSVANGIAYVFNNIEKYGGDKTKINIMGHSAGAHLAALVGTDHSYLKNAGVKPEIIKTVTSIDGAAMNIPLRMSNESHEGRWAQRMYDNTFGTNPDEWTKFSPYHFVEQDKYIPRFLFLTASERAASNVAAEGFREKLRTIGEKCQIIPIKNRNHNTINKKMGIKGDPAFAAVMDFVR